MSQVLQIEIDDRLQANAMSALAKSGLSLEEFVRLMLGRLCEDNSFIWDVDIPNELTARTLEKSEQGQDVYSAKNADDLFCQLGM